MNVTCMTVTIILRILIFTLTDMNTKYANTIHSKYTTREGFENKVMNFITPPDPETVHPWNFGKYGKRRQIGKSKPR